MTCRECDRPKIHARGVCAACYERHRVAGTLHQLPTLRRGLDNAYVVSEWRWLTSFGISRDQVAAQLGITRTALDKAIDRHHRKETAA